MISLSVKEEAKPEEELQFCGKAWKYFNTQKIEGQNRQKLFKSSNVSMTMADELINWAFESKIHEISSH